MKKKVLLSMLAVALVSIIMALGFVLPRLYQTFETRAYTEMKDMSAVLARSMALAEDGEAFLRDTKRDVPQIRLSWIGAAGEVLYDSDVAQPSELESHADREEILEALRTGTGSASRASSTLGESTHYYARKLPDGSILRVAKTGRSIVAELLGLLPSFVLIALLCAGLSVALAELLTRRLMEPINTLDLDHPEDNDVDEELLPLLKRLILQNKRIQQQLQENRENAQITSTITENMAEGLMMLSVEGHIVSINHSAARLLGGIAEDYCGLHYLAACRDLDFHEDIEHALRGQRNESRIALGDRIIQVLADPVMDGDALSGAIVLLLDVTEHEKAEETRREFSANVSHELKTPLTTIAGYAEMMQAGMTNAKDNVGLAGKILMEAQRLLTLIEDIIKLSRLDENPDHMEFATVDLYAMAEGTVERMHVFAKERQVSLSVSGASSYVTGSPVLLEEMLHNLIDNAIRYNRAGGEVSVHVSKEAEDVVLKVTDSGVGIAPEHHARIFERFYRVDKSHSRETGGTGLGLSIVKHSAQIHGSKIMLDSAPGQGTCVEIHFPPIVS